MTVANSMTSKLLALLKELHLKHPWGYGFLLMAAIEWMMSLWQDRKAFSQLILHHVKAIIIGCHPVKLGKTL